MDNDTILIVGLIVAIFFGIVAELEAHGRSWAGWGVIIGFGTLLLTRVL